MHESDYDPEHYDRLEAVEPFPSECFDEMSTEEVERLIYDAREEVERRSDSVAMARNLVALWRAELDEIVHAAMTDPFLRLQ